MLHEVFIGEKASASSTWLTSQADAGKSAVEGNADKDGAILRWPEMPPNSLTANISQDQTFVPPKPDGERSLLAIGAE
jgi:hypothetical protein